MLNLIGAIGLIAVSVMVVGAQEASTSALQCAGEFDLAKASVDFDLCTAVQKFALCIAKAPASKFVVVAEQKLAAVQEDPQFKLCDLRVNPSFHVVDREVRCFQCKYKCRLMSSPPRMILNMLVCMLVLRTIILTLQRAIFQRDAISGTESMIRKLSQ
jgi:hypothetical protein